MNLKELESYRNSSGHIDINKSGLQLDEAKFEIRGSNNEDRQKYWINLDDTKILIRTENLINNHTGDPITYARYAELLFEELAKQVDFPVAHYDLMVCNGKVGVLSESVINSNEELHSVQEFMPPNVNPTSKYTSNFINLLSVREMLRELLKNSELYPNEVLTATEDFLKMNILDMFLGSTDRHLENCAFLTSNGENGKKHIRLAPLFDNESSLSLETPIEGGLDGRYQSESGFTALMESNQPLMQIMSESDEAFANGDFSALDNLSSLDEESYTWIDTLDALATRGPLHDFALKCYSCLDIDAAIEKVEERCHIKFPPLAKQFAKKTLNYKKEAIGFELDLDLDLDLEEPSDPSEFSKHSKIDDDITI